MDSNQYLQKLNTKIAWIVFPILLLLSIVFYLERTAFLDNAFQMFLLVQDGYPRIMTNRWPALLLRVLPWLGMTLDLPLKGILILFSISFPLFHLLMWYLISIKAKATDLGLLLIFLLTLGVCDTFYWCPSDLTQATAIVLLMIALSRNIEQAPIRWILILALGITALFMHPLCIFPLGFMIIYECIYQRTFNISSIGILIGFIILWWAKSYFLSNWYDIAKQEEFTGHFDTYKHALWSMPVNAVFFKELVFKYHFFLITFIGLSIFQWMQQRFLEWLAVLGACIIYLMVIHIGHPMADNSFYREASYMLLCIFMMYPVLLYFRDAIDINFRYKTLLISVVLFLSVVRFTWYHKSYTQRIYAIEDILGKSCPKQYINESDLNSDIFKMNWAISTESWIISSIKMDKQQTLSIRHSALPDSNAVLVGPFEDYPIKSLNKEYITVGVGEYCE